MANDSSATATGGLLVVLGIIIALIVGAVLYKQGMFGGNSGPEINVQLPSNN